MEVKLILRAVVRHSGIHSSGGLAIGVALLLFIGLVCLHFSIVSRADLFRSLSKEARRTPLTAPDLGNNPARHVTRVVAGQ